MKAAAHAPVNGRIDAEGRLVEADPLLLALHQHAGGRPGGALAVPQIATLARLARRLGITVARPAIAADGERDLDLWVRAEPRGQDIALEISGWTVRSAAPAPEAPEADREADFQRAAADWTFETDETLALTQISAAGAAALGRDDAAAILLLLNTRGRLFSGTEGDAAADQLDLFDSLDREGAAEVLRLWQADAAYRASVARISTRARPSVEAA